MTVGEFQEHLTQAIADGVVTADSEVYTQHFPHDDIVYFDTGIQVWRDRVIVTAWNLPDGFLPGESSLVDEH